MNWFDHYCEETTFHGYADLKNARKRSVWGGLFWVLAILACIGAASYEVVTVFKDFKDSPVVTTYKVKSSYGITFPTVQVCLSTMVNKTKVEQMRIHPSIITNFITNVGEKAIQMNTAKKLYAESSWNMILFEIAIHLLVIQNNEKYAYAAAQRVAALFQNQRSPEDIFGYVQNQLIEMFPEYPQNETDYFQVHYGLLQQAKVLDSNGMIDYQLLVKKIQFDVEKVFIACTFAGEGLYCPNIISMEYEASFGQCFLVDVGTPQNLAGIGLQLIINGNRDLFWPAPVLEEALYIRIDKNFNPTGLNNFKVAFGSSTQILFKASHYEMGTSEKYNLCQRAMTNRKITKFPVYTGNVCRIECAHQAFMKHCGCTFDIAPKYIENPKEYASCLSTSKIACPLNYENATKNNPCLDTCLPACEYWEYQNEVTVAEFGTPAMEAVYLEGWKKELSTLDYIYLHIGFRDLQYTEVIQRETLTINGFISQIGGHLGLFLGASILSVVQLAVYILHGCFCCNESKTENEDPNRDQNIVTVQHQHNLSVSSKPDVTPGQVFVVQGRSPREPKNLVETLSPYSVPHKRSFDSAILVAPSLY